VHTIPVARQYDVGLWFTADAGQLVTGRREGYTFWDVRTWKQVRHLPRAGGSSAGPLAFSPDGRLLAVELALDVLSLLDTATWSVVARFQLPYQGRVHFHRALHFTPDGTRLVLRGYTESEDVHNLFGVNGVASLALARRPQPCARPIPQT
jgi:hypothetical protein